MNKMKRLQQRLVRPTAPGAILREDVMPALGLTQTELARRLQVSRKTISEIVLEQRPLTADMAHRLGRLLGNGAAFWLNMQRSVDIWDALHADTRKYQTIQPIALSKTEIPQGPAHP